MSKAAATKVKGSEITVGQTIKGTVLPGLHVVAEIRTGAAELRSTVNTISLHDAEGNMIWIGRTYAKVTLPA